MNNIHLFLDELRRCNFTLFDEKGIVEQYTYNGIKETEGVENYRLKLEALYNNALNDLSNIDSASSAFILLNKRIEEAKEEQASINVPTSSALQNMQDEINLHHNKSLIHEYSGARFIVAMAELQKYYLLKFKKYLSLFSPDKIIEEQAEQVISNIEEMEFKIEEQHPIAESKHIRNGMAYGYEGIMDAFGFGRNKTAQFLKDPKFQDAIYQAGRKIIVDIAKAKELMQASNRPAKPSRRG